MCRLENGSELVVAIGMGSMTELFHGGAHLRQIHRRTGSGSRRRRVADGAGGHSTGSGLWPSYELPGALRLWPLP
jgi:hypothetical protein